MAVDTDLWIGEWDENDYPSLPCPHCGAPLNAVENSLRVESSAHNVELVNLTDIDDAESRFTLWLQCGHGRCREYVTVTGDVRYEPGYDEVGATITVLRLTPVHLHRAPPIIGVGEDVPDSIRSALQESFGLFWSDSGACAARLRLVVELILEDWGFPATSKGGGFVPVDRRIKDWETMYGENAMSRALMAIKWLGNVGAHEKQFPRDRLLDAYDILERLLRQLFPPDERHLDELASEIIDSKGRRT
ncbi:MAG: DUF4145 domain-containing protein [Pseudomonadota bacterium]